MIQQLETANNFSSLSCVSLSLSLQPNWSVASLKTTYHHPHQTTQISHRQHSFATMTHDAPSLQPRSKQEKPPFNPNTICRYLHHLHKASPIPLHHCLAVILHKYKTIKQSKPPFRYWQGLTLPHVTHLFKNLRK